MPDRWVCPASIWLERPKSVILATMPTGLRARDNVLGFRV